jgi:hypothetical protein
METVARVKQNIEAVVDATRKAGDEQLAVAQRVRSRRCGCAARAVTALGARRSGVARGPRTPPWLKHP